VTSNKRVELVALVELVLFSVESIVKRRVFRPYLATVGPATTVEWAVDQVTDYLGLPIGRSDPSLEMAKLGPRSATFF
jgi:hypothetical protein